MMITMFDEVLRNKAEEKIIISNGEFGLRDIVNGIACKQIAAVYSTDLEVTLEQASVYGRRFADYWNERDELVAKCDGLTKELDELVKAAERAVQEYSKSKAGGLTNFAMENLRAALEGK